MAEKSKICKRTYDFADGIVSFAFTNGKVLTIGLADVPALLHPKFALRGLSENAQNAMASAKGNVEDAYEAVAATLETYRRGLYTERVPSEKEDPIETLAEAYSRWKLANGAFAPNREKLLARLAEMSKAERDTLRRTPAIASVIAEIKNEKRPVTVTPDSLIGSLE